MDRRSFLGLTAATATTLGFAPILSARMRGPYSASHPLLLNQNENSLGMSPRAIEAARKALAAGHRYPDDHVSALSADIARREGIAPQNMGVSNGSTGIIEAIIRGQADKKASIIAPAITYGQAAGLASDWGMAYQAVPMGVDFKMDIAAMEAASLKIDGAVLVYLVSPNNPTGRLTPSSAIAAWVKRAPQNIFFLIDEAYHELISDPLYESAVSLVKAGYKNLVVTRTFSKVYAMAGMRVGYGIAHTDVMDEIKRYYASWNVNVAALAAASAALRDHVFFKRSFDENQAAKKMVYKTMQKSGLRCILSEGNFVLHEIGMDLKAYQNAMFDRHIRVGRDMGTGQRWNRLSMGTVDEMAYFLEQFQTL
ncbi:MAG: aminotransferase class I/II-fold pyridoxal phosphate-dependent enzyme [Gammaproteobacteria bacterium]|nr:aminotransferase class I/II-fold pyridoxal phosphate-dependent enzyme [Gammaproteobacteria bacterium]